jgi:amino acid permease
VTATNHSMTGALIGLSVTNPWFALPLAVASHFVLDSLPHFGFEDLDDRSRKFTIILLIDALLCGLLVVFLFLSGHDLWLSASLAAFLAASPDFMWAPDYYRSLAGHPLKRPGNIIKRFHSRIQWFQRPAGAYIELGYGVIALLTLVNLLNI